MSGIMPQREIAVKKNYARFTQLGGDGRKQARLASRGMERGNERQFVIGRHPSDTSRAKGFPPPISL
jgi:hypothetical protein